MMPRPCLAITITAVNDGPVAVDDGPVASC